MDVPLAVAVLALLVFGSKGSDDARNDIVEKNFRGKDMELVRERLIQYRKRLEAHRAKVRETPWTPKRMAKRNVLDGEMISPHALGILEINKRLKDYLYQGDIALTPIQADALVNNEESKTVKRQAYKDQDFPRSRWNDGVPYYFDSTVDEGKRELIKKSIAVWEKNTCIRFIENGQGKTRVRFFNGDGCFSNIGKVFYRKEQDISIGQGCDTIGIIAHEIGHALGFYHEHAREDRDNYVTVDYSNMQEGWEDQYRKETKDKNDNFGVRYDHGSLMTYSDTESSKDKTRPVLIADDREYQKTMGQRIQPSFNDLLLMNRLYSCDACSSSSHCQRGGYANPNNCSKCVCPWGFGGDYCEKRASPKNAKSSCGHTAAAMPLWKTLTGQVGEANANIKNEYASCHWHIKAPTGRKVQVRITKIGCSCSDGCVWNNIEFKTKADFTYTGYRYCCENARGKLLTSESDLVVISAYSRYYLASFSVQYKYV